MAKAPKYKRIPASEVKRRCGRPKWRRTKKGVRCAAVCDNGQWRFVKREECEGSRTGPEEITEFTGGSSETSFPLADIGLLPMVEESGRDLGMPSRRRRKRRRI